MSYPYQFTENYSTPTTAQTTYPWEVEQNQDPNLRLQQPQVYSPVTEQLPQPERIVPSQQREVLEHKQIQLHPMESDEGRSEFERDTGDLKPKVHVDTQHHSNSAGNSPAASSTMPMRVSPTRAHTIHSISHPYRRPQSSSGKQRRDHEQHVRFVAPITGSAASPGPSSRVTSYGSTVTASAPSPLSNIALASDSPRRFIIRTDVHYDADSKVITAMLELPGLKKTDISVTLSTCSYNRVKQVAIMGNSKPVFPESGYAIRERKFGEFQRTLAVPPDTTAKDIQAEMQDGILIVKISCGQAAVSEDPQEIMIR